MQFFSRKYIFSYLYKLLCKKQIAASYSLSWEQRKLGELGTITTGSTPSTSIPDYYSDDGIVWVTPTDICENITFESARKLSDLGQQVGRVVPKNTILVTCIASIGKNTFIFINRFGQAQHQATLNKAIRRIIRDCNDEQFEKSEEPEVLLPHFSCHSLRHTFTTRMCEAGVNIKVIQDALGHTDISTTLNIYTDVTKELKTSEFKGLDNYFKAQ